MRYSERETMRLLKSKNLNLEDQIKANILNFIRVIHLNGYDFFASSYASEYFGALPMTFRKDGNQALGLITVTLPGEVRRYAFTEQGYECVDDLF